MKPDSGEPVEKPGADPGSEQQEARTCPVCGTKFFATTAREFCPVCILRGAFGAEPAVTGEPGSVSGSAADTAEEADGASQLRRFENYEVMLDDDGSLMELGRGAMGVTYKALDVDLRCPVTLKIISERYLGDKATRLRFLREARAAASVRHPNVASVFHLGRTGENYFYAMEFVEGETLESLIRRSDRLDVKLALEITVQVTAGLAAVHKQKLVHRDIKPSNIMVSLEDTGAVTAKIIDLGLAKSLDEPSAQTAISTPGAFAGTPEFASPEQFAGVPVDIRSDLYSLGVVLWEMVTGHAVFRGSPAEVMYQHQHAQLPLEKLEHVPRPVLVLIEVLLEKDPARRFQNPADLLNALPKVTEAVKARHTITHQSLREIAAQRPVASGKAIQILTNIRDVIPARRVRLILWPALVLVSVALSIWLLESQQHSNEQLQALQVKFEKLQDGVNSFAEVQNKVRQEQPGQKPDELEQHTYVELGKKLGLDPATLMQQLPRFAEELKKAPNATTYERANAAYVAKDYNEAERLALAAADQAKRAGPSKNEEAIKALELAGWSAEKRIEYAEALARLRDAEKLTDRTRDPLEWARVQFAIAFVLYDQGKYGDAERTFRTVLEERERVLGSEHPDTLAARSVLESALFYEGKYAESEAEARALLAIQEKVHGPEHPDTLKARNNLAGTLSTEGKYAGAEKEFRDVVRLKEKVFGPEDPNTLRSRNNLAAVLGMEGKYPEAEAEFRSAVPLYEKVFGPENPFTLDARCNLAAALDKEGKYNEAETEDRNVLKLDEKVLGPEHPDSLDTRANLASVLLHQGKYTEAEAEDRQVVKLEEKVRGPEHPNTLDTRNNLAEALDHEGKYAEAEREDRAVLELREKVLGPEHPDTLETRNNLARALADQGKYTEAETEYRAVLKVREKLLGPEHPDTLRSCFDLAVCLRSDSKVQEASSFAQRAAEGALKVLGPKNPDTKKYEQLEQELLAKKG